MGSPQALNPKEPVLVCPQCQGALIAKEEKLDCSGCRLSYPIRNGIPVMLREEAKEL